MYELELKLENSLPFASFSLRYPDLRIFRWCSSSVDYLEIYGRPNFLKEASNKLGEFAQSLGSRVVRSTLYEDKMTAMLACRCSVGNSTIRLVESKNFLWEAPARYHKGIETLRVISFEEESIQVLYSDLERIGKIEVVKKRKILPESLRDVYRISLSELTGTMTPKQIRYLRDATSMGFFASPRRIIIEDLAAMHGVSKSTMQEHINKARNKLMLSMEPYLSLAGAIEA